MHVHGRLSQPKSAGVLPGCWRGSWGSGAPFLTLWASISGRRVAARLHPLACLAAALVVAPGPNELYGEDRPSEYQMADRIDQLIDKQLHADEKVAAELCDDASFLRRASLDLCGVIPKVTEVREFLADSRIDKREIWIDRLLESPRHATHLAVTWRHLLLPADFDPQQLGQAVGLQSWLRRQFVQNLRYDRLVAEFLSSTGDQRSGPALFYRSLEAKPEKLAATTARIFLGLQIECAQCHDHPFDDWTQQDFWGYAAFFAQLQPASMMQGDQYQLVDLPTGDVTLPGTDDIVAPRFPANRPTVAIRRGSRRRQLAIWMASGDNPFLAPAAVNRAWAHLFGRGLVQPIDDLGPHNPATHPQLFDELTQYFIAVDFDLRALYRCLANTKAYHRTSKFDVQSGELSDYAYMATKRLTPEQLFDSLHRGLGLPGGVPGPNDPRRREFIATMSSPSRDVTEYDLGMQQALRLMNGQPIQSATVSASDGLIGALEAPFFDEPQRIDVLFLATVSRLPSEDERAVCREVMDAAESDAAGSGDVLWALLNSAEFQFNH